MRFSKWHALGNSYLVVEQPDAGPLTPQRVERLCSVGTGIGSDGIVEVVTRDDASADVTIWNPDGSTAEMSGNGVRIAARVALGRDGRDRGRRHDRGTCGRGAGAQRARHGHGGGRGDRRRAGALEGVELTTASVGNPHAVVRLDDPTRDDLLRLGPLLETHERFPERTNVQLVRVDGRHDLTVLVWERGAGETSASGSSSVAAAAVAVARGWCDSPVTVHLPGGGLHVRLEGGQAWLLGPAERVAWGARPAAQPDVRAPRRLSTAISNSRRTAFKRRLQIRRRAPLAHDQRALEAVRARRELLLPHAGQDDRARRHLTAVLDRRRAGDVDDRNRGGEDDVRRDHRARADADTFDDHRARADEGAVLDHDGRGLRRLEDAADPDPAREVHVGADLGTRADGGPRVDHRPRPDPGTDVDEAGHEDAALGEERAVARDRRAGRRGRRGRRSRT